MDRDDLIAHASDTLALVPFKPDEWMRALHWLAQATGSSHAQLAGWMPPNRLPFSICTDEPDGLTQRWIEAGGTDPAHNPIIRRGLSTGLLEVVSDTEVISAHDRRRHPLWGEFYDKFDIPHLCWTLLWRDGPVELMLTLPRSARDGPIRDDERRAFGALATRFRAAALLTRTLRNEAARVLTGAFDTMSIAAVVLDGFARVVAVTRAAEPILRAGTLLSVRQGRLRAHRSIARDFEAAVRRSVTAAVPPPAPATLAASDKGGSPVAIRVSPLPREHDGVGFGAAALVVIEHDAGPSLAPAIRAALTPAENAVALSLVQGLRPAEIAAQRGVSIETVRWQIKNLYAKVGVSGHVEFIARMRSAGGRTFAGA